MEKSDPISAGAFVESRQSLASAHGNTAFLFSPSITADPDSIGSGGCATGKDAETGIAAEGLGEDCKAFGRSGIATIPGSRVGEGRQDLEATEGSLSNSSPSQTASASVAPYRHQAEPRQIPPPEAVNMSSTVESLICELDHAIVACSGKPYVSSSSSEALLVLRESLESRRQDRDFDSMRIRRTKNGLSLPS